MEIGRYTLQDAIASGSNAASYLALDSETGKTVVIKFLARALTFNAYARGQFRRDVEKLMALKQPQIVPILRFGQLKEQTYLVSPYFPKGSLSDRLHPHISTLIEVKRILEGIAPALDVAHAAGITHGNLKPTNILFDANDVPYVADFGLDQAEMANSGLLRGRQFRGTGYLSPEQIRGERLTSRSDVYSLGVMMYEMITGERPFSAETPQAMLEQHLNAPPRKRHNELDPIMRHVLSKAPSVRPATVAQLCAMVPSKLSDQGRWWQLMSLKRRLFAK